MTRKRDICLHYASIDAVEAEGHYADAREAYDAGRLTHADTLQRLAANRSYESRHWRGRAEDYVLPRCKWCARITENSSRKCDECLREIENDRRIDERRGK